jgi:ubiquinone/menaquinone biosynthesis C-methylase UbiE
MTEDFIKSFWQGQADRFGTSHEASWGDGHMIKLEIENIGKYVHQDQSILDVGCGNGYATLRHAQKNPKSIVGVDFAERMIEQAKKACIEAKTESVSFQVGDVRALAFPDNSFDLVYTTRVLINLPSWEQQKTGIQECIRVCKPGGSVLLSEAFWEPLVRLNALRSLVGLPALIEHDFNRYLKKERLEQYLKSLNVTYEVVDFCSVYYLGSRFLREIVTNPADYPGYSNPINAIFYDIEQNYSGGDLGIQQLFVLRKSSHPVSPTLEQMADRQSSEQPAAAVDASTMPILSANYAEKVEQWSSSPQWLIETQAFLATNDLKGTRVLDYGCGTGRAYEVANSLGVKCYRGVDINPYYRFGELGPNGITQHLAFGAKLPFANRSFDVAFLSHVLPHLGTPLDELADVCRCIRPGGLLGIAITNANYFRASVLSRWWNDYREDPTINRWYTIGGVQRLVERFGRIISIKNFGRKYMGIGPSLRAHIWVQVT